MATWFPDPVPASTDLVSAGSRAWLKASDTLRYWRSGRGANRHTGSWPQVGTASPGSLAIKSFYSLSLALPRKQNFQGWVSPSPSAKGSGSVPG